MIPYTNFIYLITSGIIHQIFNYGEQIMCNRFSPLIEKKIPKIKIFDTA